MSSALIHHHLGLGDHLDCNGLVRYILKYSCFNRIYIPAKQNYFAMVQFMYRDCPDIEVIEIDPQSITEEYEQIDQILSRIPFCNRIRVGHDYYPSALEQRENENCWVYFYRQLGIPISVRYDNFYIKRDAKSEAKSFYQLTQGESPYFFVHDDPARGFNINISQIHAPSGCNIVRNDTSYSIFDFISVLESAAQIHVMESSFKSLVELFPSVKAPCFFHDFRGHPLGSVSRSRWSIVNY